MEDWKSIRVSGQTWEALKQIATHRRQPLHVVVADMITLAIEEAAEKAMAPLMHGSATERPRGIIQSTKELTYERE